MTLLLSPVFWGIAILSLALSMFGGCRWQASNDADKIQNAELQRDLYKNDVSTLAESLNQINAVADQAKREAAARASEAAQAVEDSKTAGKVYDGKVSDLEEALAKAKRAPACRAQLEAPLCADLE